MGLPIFSDMFSIREATENLNEKDQSIFDDIFGVAKEYVDSNAALEIPIVNACISKISDIIATTDLKMYKKTEKGVEIVENDSRVKLLNTNVDNGNLNSFELKKMIVRDYFLKGRSYFYIKRTRNEVKDIVYLKDVSISTNNDYFNKDYKIQAYGKNLRNFELLKIVRNSTDGMTGKSVVEESNLQFLLILKTMDKMLNEVQRGFLPKGFFKMERNVRDLKTLKNAIKEMLKETSTGYMLMNEGVSFESIEKNKDAEKEALANSMEINRIAALFGVPVSIINGGGSEEDKFNFINFTILPLLSNIEASLNRDLLMENEKGVYYFAFETKEILKGNLLERMQAYKVAIDNNILTMDEVRDIENLPRHNFGFYKMSIADAFYYKEQDKLVNVNSGVVLSLSEGKFVTNVGEQMVQQGNTDAYLNKHKSLEQGNDLEELDSKDIGKETQKGGVKNENKDKKRQRRN